MGSYEKVLTSVLADVTITDAEAKLIGYLATRPPGWTVIPSAIARDLKRNERYWVRPTLKLLQARGILARTRDRGEHGQLGAVTYTICRDMIIAFPQVRASDCETAHGEPPQAVSQHVVPPAETQTPRSDHTLSDHTLSNNRRVRTEREVRTDKDLPAGQPAAENAGSLVALWIDHCAEKPPKTTIARLGQRIKKLLDDGVPYRTVRAGLYDWHQSDAPVASLDHFVAQRAKGVPVRPRGNRHQQNDQALTEYLAAQESAQQNGYPPLTAVPGRQAIEQ
jgi:hypothetical protein